MKMLNMKTIVTLAMAIVLLSGCVQTRYTTIERNSNAALPFAVSVGDHVKVITTEANEAEFTVTAVSENSLIGDETEIPFDDIWKLEKEEVDKPLTAGVFASGTLVLLLTLGIVGAAIVL